MRVAYRIGGGGDVAGLVMGAVGAVAAVAATATATTAATVFILGNRVAVFIQSRRARFTRLARLVRNRFAVFVELGLARRTRGERNRVAVFVEFGLTRDRIAMLVEARGTIAITVTATTAATAAVAITWAFTFRGAFYRRVSLLNGVCHRSIGDDILCILRAWGTIAGTVAVAAITIAVSTIATFPSRLAAIFTVGSLLFITLTRCIAYSILRLSSIEW